MSEYQYYEFLATDRALSEEEMGKLRALSSRARITPTSFVNVYNWGDFGGNPRKVLAGYFDAFVYVANWGSHWFMLRLPTQVVDEDTASAYCAGESAALIREGGQLLLGLRSEEESDTWEEGDGWMSSLIAVRADLLAGDLRCLYLGWLLCVQSGELDDDELAPPPPPGLQDLSASLEALAEFLRIDPNLLEAAAEGGPIREQAELSPDQLQSWMRSLPAPEKDAILLRLAEGAGADLRWELLRRFRQERTSTGTAGLADAGPRRRTVGQLLAARDARAEQKQARVAVAEVAERRTYLDDLEAGEADVWQRIEELIQTKQPQEYDDAVGLLDDLRDMAARSGRSEEIAAHTRELRRRHHRKWSLMRRLDEAGLGK